MAQPAILERTVPVEPMLIDGLYVDPDTGEVIGAEEADKPEFGSDYAEWVLAKLLRHESKKLAAGKAVQTAREQVDEIVRRAIEEVEKSPEMIVLRAQEANATRIESDAGKAYDWLLTRFEDDLTKFAQQQTEGKDTRTVRLVNGALSLRKSTERLKVVDEDKAIPALEAAGQGAAIKKSVLISKVEQSAWYGLAHDPESGLVIEPETDKLTVKLGVKK